MVICHRLAQAARDVGAANARRADQETTGNQSDAGGRAPAGHRKAAGLPSVGSDRPRWEWIEPGASHGLQHRS